MSFEHDATVAVDPTATDRAGRADRATPGPGLRPGSMLAHFQVEALLGRGGMGEVYRATDLALDRPVALKVLPGLVAQDPGRRDRLVREARSQARLQHPNVCHIYFVGEQDGAVFFAMELVVGESLAERLARGPVPADEAIELIRQAALGLREAQRHGFTHRDVKPSNLMVDREGRVKVVDFGLVKVTGDRPEGGEARADGPDRTGVVGTPLYMAPEQAAGDTSDARADIYALGATLHHLVSGRPPFQSDSADELATLHRQEPRPNLAAGGRRGRALSTIDAVIGRMMAKRPEDRFASYDELIGELERVSPARTRPAGFWVRGLAAVIDLTVLALALLPVQIAAAALDREIDDNLVFAVIGPLYYVVGLTRWGATVGRSLLDIEVVAVAPVARPTVRQAVIRHVVEYAPLDGALVAAAIAAVASAAQPIAGGATAVLGIGGVVWLAAAMAWASVRAPDKRAPWDRAAGTMVRYRARAAYRSSY
jgi:hypothetical protein